MPIRFRGPVRPHKLKSPDPINMPVVRNDKVPRIKSEVLYYKENGSLPTEPDGDQTSGFGHSDWQAGDGLVTSDYYTGLDWLKMPATITKSIPDVEALLATEYSGWRVANNWEVITFFNNIILDTDQTFTDFLFDPTPGLSAYSKAVPPDVREAFKEYIGYVSRAAYGWWYEYASDQPSVTDGTGSGGLWPDGTVYDWRHAESEQHSNYGVFLVRNGTKPTYIDQTPPFPRGNFNPSNFYTDPVTGLKWLRLIYTDAVPINTATSDPKYAGLRLATPEEVEELLFNFFGRSFEITNRAPAGPLSVEELQNWHDTFGITGGSEPDSKSYGTWVDDDGTVRFSGARGNNVNMYHGYIVGSNKSGARDQDGVFLVQE